MAVLQAHADGLTRDKAALQQEVAALQASLEEAQRAKAATEAEAQSRAQAEASAERAA